MLKNRLKTRKPARETIPLVFRQETDYNLYN